MTKALHFCMSDSNNWTLLPFFMQLWLIIAYLWQFFRFMSCDRFRFKFLYHAMPKVPISLLWRSFLLLSCFSPELIKTQSPWMMMDSSSLQFINSIIFRRCHRPNIRKSSSSSKGNTRWWLFSKKVYLDNICAADHSLVLRYSCLCGEYDSIGWAKETTSRNNHKNNINNYNSTKKRPKKYYLKRVCCWIMH